MTNTGLENLRVLIVEDDSPSRLGLTMVLELKVGHVFQADNGVEGLAVFRDLSPDVIITDIRMPVMDGLSMIRGVRDAGGDPFVIVASGFGEEDAYLEAIELGVNLFVKKPYRAEDILDGLDRACRDIARRRHDAYRRAIHGGILSNIPNCHLLTDGDTVFYFNDPKGLLPAEAEEGQELTPYLRGNFAIAMRHGMSLTSMPQDIRSWLTRHLGEEFVLAGNAQNGQASRYLLRIDPARIHETDLSLLTFTDISRIEAEKERFYQLAGKDFLTGVGNRQALEDELVKEAGRAERHGSELSLVMLDLDDFKSVNDTFGHQKGDEVLLATARLITQNVRVTDVVCRYGGEEFMVIMPQTGLEGAHACAEKLAQAIAANEFGIGRSLTASLGVARLLPGEMVQHMIRRVDMALYEAKKAGKNRVVQARDMSFRSPEVLGA